MKEAPLFVDAYDLALDLCRHLQRADVEQWCRANQVLGQRAVSSALDLVDRITLALKGFDRDDNAAAADESLAVLRVQLRLAMDLGLVERRQHLSLIERMDAIGRQLGGWRKSLNDV
jgi:hypothetical protein